jgi:hypothetical protein
MNRLVVVIVFALVIVASPAFAESPLKIDVGGGFVFQDFESRSDGTGADPRGIFGTLGWSMQNGFVARLNLSKTSDEGGFFNDIGFGFENVLEEMDLVRLDATAGFMFNRRGLVRPILRGGFARVQFEDKFTGLVSGASGKVIDDDDMVITLGASIEVGQDNHILLIDVGSDSGLEMVDAFGTTIKFNLTSVHFGYVHRF